MVRVISGNEVSDLNPTELFEKTPSEEVLYESIVCPCYLFFRVRVKPHSSRLEHFLGRLKDTINNLSLIHQKSFVSPVLDTPNIQRFSRDLLHLSTEDRKSVFGVYRGIIFTTRKMLRDFSTKLIDEKTAKYLDTSIYEKMNEFPVLYTGDKKPLNYQLRRLEDLKESLVGCYLPEKIIKPYIPVKLNGIIPDVNVKALPDVPYTKRLFEHKVVDFEN